MAKNLNDIFQAPIRTTLTSEVAQLIHKAIENGQFEAGEQLTESRIAKQLKISRAPVREALHQLEQDGLLGREARGQVVWWAPTGQGNSEN